MPWIGPVPGDIAEVEAYCRIFRAAERLHASLMDTLCNPLTGECVVSYDFTIEEKPVMEDKIVSVLGCMLSLLNKGKEDVLSGRSSIMNSFRLSDASVTEDTLPPLAIFRGEMKRCCESLHIALENYLSPDDGRSLDLWRKLQGLKNVCYDSGFPRRDDFPSQTVFANWSPIYVSTSKEEIESNDSEVAFWSGGQVTEEGLNYLIERGFKTVVDLRAEVVRDDFYESALDFAISAGKVELIKIPVEVRTAPSMEQVEKFAALVSNQERRPIYLHSKEGVWRTSSMVSRWRQYMTRHSSRSTIQVHEIEELKSSFVKEENALLNCNQETLKLSESLGKHQKSNGVSEVISVLQPENGLNTNATNNGQVPLEVAVNRTRSSATNIFRETNPIKAQVPPSNFFSKAEMSKFFQSRKISPSTYSNYQIKRIQKLITFTESKCAPMKVAGESSGTTGTISSNKTPPNPQSLTAKSVKNLNGSVHSQKKNTSTEAKRSHVAKTNGSSTVSVEGDYKNNGLASRGSSDDESEPIGGNMCASATGVVRLQSRRKAEMFLVRTDGFSCTREKVTESSLAFTHPSTQQQMLMWKSPPKTVLLLKKLGQELMEEAKEVLCNIVLFLPP